MEESQNSNLLQDQGKKDKLIYNPLLDDDEDLILDSSPSNDVTKKRANEDSNDEEESPKKKLVALNNEVADINSLITARKLNF